MLSKDDNKVNSVASATKGSRLIKYLCALLVFALCFVMLLSCLGDHYFDSDEGDIYSKGMAIAHGQLLYKDFASQHTPVMYYIAAVFNLLGIRTITEFRIGFYILFSLLWALSVIWYGDRINKLTLILYPVLFIVQIKFIENGTSILSDHAQSMGIAILCLELICFYQTNELKAGNYARISLAIFLSLGSAFTSVFPIFYLAMTVCALEIKHYIVLDALGKERWKKEILIKYLRLVAAVALPFIALILYYLFTGSLADFYYWTYKFNVTIYSKYQPTGSSVLQSFFIGFRHLLLPFVKLGTQSGSYIRALFTVLGMLSILLIGVHSKSVILPAGLVMMLVGCETRSSIDSFHAMHAMMLQCVCIGYVVGIMVDRHCPARMRTVLCTGIVITAMIPFAGSFKNLAALPPLKLESPIESEAFFVDAITDEGDRVGNSTLKESVYIASETVPASIVSGTVRWMWEGAGERAMAQLRADPPKTYVLNKDYAIWGYPIEDFAQDLIDFVEENYTPLSNYSQDHVYVLNSYYDEACRLVDEAIEKRKASDMEA